MESNRTLITPEQTKSKYFEANGTLEFADRIFDDTSFFNMEGAEFSNLIFINCLFRNSVILKPVFVANKLSFIDCVFEKDLTSLNIDIRDEQHKFDITHIVPSLYFSRCKIKGLLGIAGEVKGSVWIEESEIDVLGMVLRQTDFLRIVKCKINTLTIREAKVLKNTLISHNTIDLLDVKEIDCGEILISGNTITDFQLSEKVNFEEPDGRIEIHSNVIDSCNIKISQLFNGHYIISNNIFKKEGLIAGISPTSTDKILQKGNGTPNFFPKVFFDNNIIEYSLNIEINTKLELLSIILSPVNKGMLNINGSKAHNLKLMGTLQGGTLNIDFTGIINVEIDRLINYGNIIFSNYKPIFPAKFKVTNSNLGAADLSISDLNRHTSVDIVHSNISDLKFSAVKWFDERNLNILEAEYARNTILTNTRNNQLHDIFKQMRKAAEKSSDKGLTAHFRALEHKYQLKELQATKPFYHQERLLLTFNLSNKFGTDWFRPIYLAVAITLVGYLFIVASFSLHLFHLNGGTLNGYVDNLGKFAFAIPQLFNPAHSLSNIFDYRQYPNVHLNFGSHLVSLLLRLCISFLLVQTVIAFRKQSN
ncbi:hypothetical protein [Pedobacter sp. ASV28]|uniref:hypothetical protein n=1 Tax=Pedobacter sp. ASV28 TaxID=2795123 RepID=UPI0018ECA97C|nr:hypothetical protein [Pedobacter sp. ASV28]